MSKARYYSTAVERSHRDTHQRGWPAGVGTVPDFCCGEKSILEAASGVVWHLLSDTHIIHTSVRIDFTSRRMKVRGTVVAGVAAQGACQPTLTEVLYPCYSITCHRVKVVLWLCCRKC